MSRPAATLGCLLVLLVCAGATAVSSSGAVVSCDRVVGAGGSVQQLMDSLAPGQTGCLREGSYDEAVRVNHPGAPGAPITLASYPGEHATINGRFYIPSGSDHITLTDLHLNGANPQTLPSPQINADNITLTANDITNNHNGICIVIGSRQWGHATNTTIDHNTIHDCGRLPATNHDHGIYVEDATNTLITQNLIHDNADRGINLYYNADHTLITHNTIDHNGEGILFAGDDQTASSNNTASDNIITNSQIRSDVESSWQPGHTGTNNTLTNNCIHGGKTTIDTGSGGYTATNNTITDPQYTNTTTYTTNPTSPCQTKGATDFAEPRPEDQPLVLLPAVAVPAQPAAAEPKARTSSRHTAAQRRAARHRLHVRRLRHARWVAYMRRHHHQRRIGVMRPNRLVFFGL
jgi:parallel beta-helix repeat protein